MNKNLFSSLIILTILIETDGHDRVAADGHLQDGGVQAVLRRSSSR